MIIVDVLFIFDLLDIYSNYYGRESFTLHYTPCIGYFVKLYIHIYVYILGFINHSKNFADPFTSVNRNRYILFNNESRGKKHFSQQNMYLYVRKTEYISVTIQVE